MVLVDLDLRRPALDRFFELGNRPGLTDVALGQVGLDEAITQIALSEPAASGEPVYGVLEVLGSGPLPPDPCEFVATKTLADILHELRDRADFVFVDAPPLLRVGDAMTLTSKIDGLLLVTRLSIVRRGMLDEVHRLLETVPAAKLGFVLTGAADMGDETYGGYYGYRPAERPAERVGKTRVRANEPDRWDPTDRVLRMGLRGRRQRRLGQLPDSAGAGATRRRGRL